MPSPEQHPPSPSRRHVLRSGAKLAYVAPVVLAALQVESAFAASGGSTGTSGNNGNNRNGGNNGKNGK